MGIVLQPGEGRSLDLGKGFRLCFKVDDAETAGRYSVSVTEVAANDSGTTPHVHREHDELFFVLEGTPSFEIEGESHQTAPGTFVLVPRGSRHRWWNPGDTPARVLDVHAPSFGFERFIRALVDLSAAGEATPAAMVELGARYDAHFDRGVLEDRYGSRRR
jgi:mannose-6-phosphate isomerase-like protein (cupin superfamily)